MKHALTPRQLEAYNFIRIFIKEKGVSPTSQEIADALKMKSRNSACKIVDAIVDRGHLTKIPGASRSISVVTDEREELARLREVRDSAGVFIQESRKYREVYEKDQASEETREAGPRVADALKRLEGVLGAGT
jgi:SOS-response transcriptional repressor LexA